MDKRWLPDNVVGGGFMTTQEMEEGPVVHVRLVSPEDQRSFWKCPACNSPGTARFNGSYLDGIYFFPVVCLSCNCNYRLIVDGYVRNPVDATPAICNPSLRNAIESYNGLLTAPWPGRARQEQPIEQAPQPEAEPPQVAAAKPEKKRSPWVEACGWAMAVFVLLCVVVLLGFSFCLTAIGLMALITAILN
jgi:nitrate reductase NapE component